MDPEQRARKVRGGPVSVGETTRYSILVESSEPRSGEYEPERLVDGFIDLEASTKWLLERRLAALQEADIIGSWAIEPYEAPQGYSEAGVLNFVAGVGEWRDEDIVKVWEDAAP